MSAEWSVSDNFDAVAAKITSQMTPALAAAVQAWLDAAAQTVLAAVPSHMHFQNPTGALQASLTTLATGEMEREVGTDQSYSPFVEWGTGQRGAASGVTPGDGYAYGGKPGMAAEPYLAPTVRDTESALFDDLRARIAIAL